MLDVPGAADGYSRWERWVEWPLVGLALLFLAVLILPLAEPLTPAQKHALDVANVAIWAIFVVDYAAGSSWPWTGGSSSGATSWT